MKKSSGFTLMEILIVISLVAIIAAVSMSAFAGFSRRQALDASTEAIASSIREARAATLASVGRTQYGVAFSEEGYVIFQGTAYEPSESTNENILFPPSVRASSTLSQIVFERLTGNSTASGTIDLYLSNDPESKRTVSVSGTGLVGIR